MGTEVSLGEVLLYALAVGPTAWILVCWLASRVGGWGTLARRFGSPGPSGSVGEGVHFGSAQIGWGNYGGALEVRASASGLYLSTVRVFRPFHPPLLIPWGEIVVLPPARPGRPPWLAVRSVSGVRIRFSGRAWALVRRYLPTGTGSPSQSSPGGA